MRIDMPKITLNPNWDKLNVPLGLLIDTERGNSMKSFVSVEEGVSEFYELEGKVDKGLSLIKIHGKDGATGNPPPARLISVSLRDSSRQLCRINRMAVVFIPMNIESVEP